VIETYVAPGVAGIDDATVARGTFRLVEVLKGEPPADRMIISAHTMCESGLLLVVGINYLIFLNEGSNIVVSALGTAGTRPMSPTDFRVGRLRDLSKKAQ
jgi:hypothetical protein